MAETLDQARRRIAAHLVHDMHTQLAPPNWRGSQTECESALQDYAALAVEAERARLREVIGTMRCLVTGNLFGTDTRMVGEIERLKAEGVSRSAMSVERLPVKGVGSVTP